MISTRITEQGGTRGWNGFEMPLTIKSRIEDGFAIVEIAGQLTLGPGLPVLREDIRKMLGAKQLSGLILQVSEVTQADSSGLGELTMVYTLATKRGCAIRLVEASARLKKMLEVTHLDGLLPTATDIPSAKAEIQKL